MTVQRWNVKFKNGKETLNDASGRGRKPSVIKCIPKQLTSFKVVMYAMFFGMHGLVVLNAISKNRSVTAKFYKPKVLANVEK